MKSRGFTLVELLTVIILLGVLSAVIIPKINDSLTSSRNRAYQVQVESIKKGVNDFLIDNDGLVFDDGTLSLTLGVVKQGGYLPVDIKNPLTKKSFSNGSVINVVKTNGVYNIEVNLVDVENYNESLDSNSPILVLNGDYIEYVDVFSDYVDKGATAQDYLGSSIDFDDTPQYFLDDHEVAQIDTSVVNKVYTAVYSVTDSNGFTISATRTINIVDNEAPVITVPQDVVLSVSDVSLFDVMDGVSVTDNYDQDLTVNADSSLTSAVGKYVITYSATDSSGNTSSVRRVVNVRD